MSRIFASLFRFIARWSGVEFTPLPPLAPGPRPAPGPDVRPEPPPPSPALPSPPTPDPTRPGGVVAAINGARASAGLPALLEDPVLDRSAAEWSRFLASGQSLTHGDFNARISALYPGQAAGEDIAEGQPTPEAVVAAWMASPPHRANILGDFNRAGVGSSEDTRGSIYWCAEFVRAT